MKQVKTAFYLLQSKTNKKGEAPVYFRAKFKRQTIRLSTGIYLNPDNWDNQKLRVKAKHPRSYNLNKQMKDMQDKFFKILDHTMANSTTVSLNNVKQILNGKDDKGTSLLSLTNYFIN